MGVCFIKVSYVETRVRIKTWDVPGKLEMSAKLRRRRKKEVKNYVFKINM